jgi:hypothetical protein
MKRQTINVEFKFFFFIGSSPATGLYFTPDPIPSFASTPLSNYQGPDSRLNIMTDNSNGCPIAWVDFAATGTLILCCPTKCSTFLSKLK